MRSLVPWKSSSASAMASSSDSGSAWTTLQQAVMRPAQFGTQCVSNWKCLKKSTHVAKIPPIKPLPLTPVSAPPPDPPRVPCRWLHALLRPAQIPRCAAPLASRFVLHAIKRHPGGAGGRPRPSGLGPPNADLESAFPLRKCNSH